MKDKKPKMLRLSAENLEVRNAEQDESKMIIEGYPVVFNKEVLIHSAKGDYYEQIDRNAFEGADLSDVALKYNHSDTRDILARGRNNSLMLNIDDHGMFMHAELLPDVTSHRDAYALVKSGLVPEGSFAFTVAKYRKFYDANGMEHKVIEKIGKVFDVTICPNGAYGDLTEIYARSYDEVETEENKAEAQKRCEILRLKNINKIKIMRCSK